MEVSIDRFVTGPIDTNTYVVSREDYSGCLVVDPSSGCDEVLAYIRENGLTVEGVLLTHGHFDHVLGVEEITAVFPRAGVWVHPDETALLGDPMYNGGVMMGLDFRYTEPVEHLAEGPMTVGGYTFEVRHVPGHSPGGCVFVFDGNCLSGDTVFAGSIGRTDFPGCDGALFMRGIREKLLTLPDETVLWPGHMSRTTVGREKRLNPYFRG
ncbi:MAG: MBL fold metallo-hydrolase, partial [Chitinivibrionales bacterium]|nr:MBL fold metallo-hydrolase [Chitinivibrionales bacterium]MBD3396716.1 MBL fold metallo-hydrolase [Chitinivibrionales bacterium]